MEPEIKIEAIMAFLKRNNFNWTESVLEEEIMAVQENDLPKLPPVRLQASEDYNVGDGNSTRSSFDSDKFLTVFKTPKGFFNLDLDMLSPSAEKELSDDFSTARDSDCSSLSESEIEEHCQHWDSSAFEGDDDASCHRQVLDNKKWFQNNRLAQVDDEEHLKFENVCHVKEDFGNADRNIMSEEEVLELKSVVDLYKLRAQPDLEQMICDVKEYESKTLDSKKPNISPTKCSSYISDHEIQILDTGNKTVLAGNNEPQRKTLQQLLASTIFACSEEPTSRTSDDEYVEKRRSPSHTHKFSKKDEIFKLSSRDYQHPPLALTGSKSSRSFQNSSRSSSASSMKDKEVLSINHLEQLCETYQTRNDCHFVKETSEDVLKENQGISVLEDSVNVDAEDNHLIESVIEDDNEEFDLKIILKKNRTGYEAEKDFPIEINSIIAGRYQVIEHLGSAAFSNAVQAHDLYTGLDVCMKIIKNNKDFLDQSLDEIKLLKYVNRHDPADKYHIVRLYDYFYYREHLFIVCELLRANLYEFQTFNKESGREEYFNMPHLQSIAVQVLESLDFLHGIGLIHCDLKPENILMKNFSRCEVKVIDLGSSCFQTDNLSTYVQSRAYRAPEVILGLSYDEKIDMWSLGCILAELCSGNMLLENDSVATLLASIIGIIGPMDPEMLENGLEAHKYFTDNYLLYEQDEETGHFEYIVPKITSLRHCLPMGDPGFIEFVQYLLQINPLHRPSAKEALEHPWLSYQYETDF